MRSSAEIVPENDDEAYVRGFDQIQIDNPDPNAFTRLLYLERIETIRKKIHELLPGSGRIADIGCAQANLALLLAEDGYEVDAFDLNERFLAYAKKKWERGVVRWHSANAFEIAEANSFDAVVLGEILEHVAHPDELLDQAVSLLRIGGIVVATTPNGRFIRDRLPSYAEVIARGDQARLEAEQFGPGGEHHLFAYTEDEMRAHVPTNARLLSIGYLGSGLYNSHVQSLLSNKTTGAAMRTLASSVTNVPVLRSRLGASMIMVLRRSS